MAEGGSSLRRRLGGLAPLDDDALELAETALLLAGLDRPVNAKAGLTLLAEWGAALAGVGAGAEDRADKLAELLVTRQGFRIDDRDDDDIANANLSWVFEQRRGTAEALGILWLEVARRAGWAAEGLAFPGQFLVRLQDDDGRRAIVDPSAGGILIDPPTLRALVKANSGLAAELDPALFAPLSNRDILVRLQNEVKLRLLRGGEIGRAVVVVESVLLFAPDRPLLWREAGLMHMRLDNLPAAVAALEQFIARTGNGTARRRTQQLLQEIRARMVQEFTGGSR